MANPRAPAEGANQDRSGRTNWARSAPSRTATTIMNPSMTLHATTPVAVRTRGSDGRDPDRATEARARFHWALPTSLSKRGRGALVNP